MESIDVEGATGNINTNFSGKASAAIEAFRGGKDFVYVHVEAPDECGHRAETENKVHSIELIDEKILVPVYKYLSNCGDGYKIMVLPDHPTPVSLRTHSSEPVPFFIYDPSTPVAGVKVFCEEACANADLYVEHGYDLLSYMI